MSKNGKNENAQPKKRSKVVLKLKGYVENVSEKEVTTILEWPKKGNVRRVFPRKKFDELKLSSRWASFIYSLHNEKNSNRLFHTINLPSKAAK
jgi:hypothetical protein